MTQFNETELTEAVLRSFDDTPNPRARFLLQELVKSLHDYVSKTDLTFEEWEFAIDFLTRTGQKCTPIRQEFILLSDVLGVSMLVDAVNHREREGATQTTVLQENDGPRRFRINGSLNLERYFKRTWVASLNLRRDTEFLPGFTAPVFTERARVSLDGYLAKRLIFNLSADGGQGEVAFYDSRKFISYTGGTRLTFAMTRYLGVFTQYYYYKFQNPPEATPFSIAPRMARRRWAWSQRASMTSSSVISRCRSSTGRRSFESCRWRCRSSPNAWCS